eukprot:NODE_45_length_32908_cov_0.790271.p10 type:complete len:339 gc:universal NODE_45_length_32908_cov_0.790271:21232-20216(-)
MVLFTIVLYSMMASRCNLKSLKSTMVDGQSLVANYNMFIPKCLLDPSSCPVGQAKDLANQLLNRIRTYGLQHKECLGSILQYAGVKLTRNGHLKKRMQNGYEQVGTRDSRDPDEFEIDTVGDTSSANDNSAPTVTLSDFGQEQFRRLRNGVASINPKWAKVVLLIVGLMGIGGLHELTTFNRKLEEVKTNSFTEVANEAQKSYDKSNAKLGECVFGLGDCDRSSHVEICPEGVPPRSYSCYDVDLLNLHLGTCNEEAKDACQSALANGCTVKNYGTKTPTECADILQGLKLRKGELKLRKEDASSAETKVILYDMVEIGEEALFGIVFYWLGLTVYHQ